SAVVFPLVRETYFNFKGAQLFQCFFFGDIRHPLQLLDAVTHCSNDIVYHLLGIFFSFLWEILLGIQLTDCLSNGAFRSSQNPFPSWPHLLSTFKLTAIKVKIGFYKLVV